jgi:hypothetical protein
MMPLPPGCKVTYSVYLDVNKLDDDMVEWFQLIGGETRIDESQWSYSGKQLKTPYVRYGKAKWCHHHHNGSGGTRLHFMGEDVSVASMFLLKYSEHVTKHNMQEAMERYQREAEFK